MSMSLDNQYKGSNPAILQIFKSIADDKSIDKVSLSLLIDSNIISISEKFDCLAELAKYKPEYRQLYIDFVKQNAIACDELGKLDYFESLIIDCVNCAAVLSDSEVMKLYGDIVYLISQGVVQFYPYLWHLFDRRDKATSLDEPEYIAASFYSSVFCFNGFNVGSIKQHIKRAPYYSEGSLEVFNLVKTKEQTAYSEYSRAMLSIMKDGYRGKGLDDRKFERHLHDIPNQYRHRFYVDSLIANEKRIYSRLVRFFEGGGVKKVYDFMTDLI